MVVFRGKKKKTHNSFYMFFLYSYTTIMLTILLTANVCGSPHTTSNALRQQLGELQCNSTLIGPGHRVRQNR